jgi:hypothetical protein
MQRGPGEHGKANASVRADMRSANVKPRNGGRVCKAIGVRSR